MAFISIDTLIKKATIAGTEKIPVSPTEYIDISAIAEFANEQSGDGEAASKTTKVVAGAGLTGGGTLESDRTLNVESANDGITVNADNIQLNVVDNLTSTSATQPLSANQGKMLDAAKVNKITGKGLSTEDYTTAEKSKVANVPLNTNTELAAKVDKVVGKSLILDTEINRLATVTNQTKETLGIENVDNTSDLNKPVSTATQTALNGKVNTTDIEQVRSQDTNKVASSKLLDDELTALNTEIETKVAELSEATVYMSANDYQILIDNELVDPNVEYNIYEE